MEEIVKHINDTNASYRDINAGDAKNTDLFLDQDHKQFFSGLSSIRVIFHKDNLMQAMLFISSLLPRKYDRSSEHYRVPFSTDFVYDNILKLEGLFAGNDTFEMVWAIRTDVPQKNGKIDERFYMNGLIHEYSYTNKSGVVSSAKFTIRDYLAGGFSDIHFVKTDIVGTFNVYITNTTTNQSEEDGNNDIIDKSNNAGLQQIYYGAPGTGKSHIINEITERESVIRTTFHPDSDYSTFVGAYKPTTKEVVLRDLSGHPVKENGITLTEDRIIYEFVDQAFLQAYVQAWKYYAEADKSSEPQKQYLIIEEINRGNCAQIFGDLFQLLDRNCFGFSDYPIHADNDMRKQIAKAFKGLSISQADRINNCYKGKDVTSKILSGEILLLPNNLYIWATMNTSDQSLFPIDSAFKRRWDWQYLPICKGRDENGNELNWKIAADTKEYDWWSFLTKINDHINSTTNSEDKKLGFFFCKPQDGCISSETFVGKVIFYLWNDVFKDFGFEGPIFKDFDGSELSFNKFYKTDDKGMAVVQKDKVELFLNNLGVDSWDISYDESYTTSSAFRFNGSTPDTLGNIAKAVVEKYAIDHPLDGAQSIRDLFVNTCKGIGVAHIVETESEYHLRDGQSSQKRSSQELTMPNGEKIYVSTQWRAKNDDDNFMKFIKIVKDNNWGEITCDLNATEGFDIDSDTAGAGKADHKETLVSVTVNGERLTADGITQFDLYLNAIKKIGVDKIGPALEAMKYRRKGSPMATKNKAQGVLNSEGYSYVEADGYYFVKGANGYTLVRILEDLNKSLNLNIQIEYR